MKKPVEKLIIGFSWLCTVILLGAVFSIAGFLFFKGYSTLNTRLIFGDTGVLDALLLKKEVFSGLFPAVAGTLALVTMSVMWAIPVGIATGIYLAEYAGNRVKGLFNLLVDILAAIPSIVIGLFGFAFSIFLHKNVSQAIQPCLLISSIALAFLVLPYPVRTTQVALEGLPEDIRLGGLALGATKMQNIFYVLLPKSLSGIMSGVILAIGRCAEDTAVIMLTGVVATAGIPKSLFSNYEALPFYIYYISSQYTTPEELLTGYGASIILLAICIILFSAALIIKKRLTYMAFYRI